MRDMRKIRIIAILVTLLIILVLLSLNCSAQVNEARWIHEKGKIYLDW